MDDRMKGFTKIFLAKHFDKEHYESSLMYLCWDDKGPYLLEDVYTVGSSVSHWGGGVVRTDLPRNFYAGQTPDSFAEHFSERFREQIRNNQELAAFLAEANRRREK